MTNDRLARRLSSRLRLAGAAIAWERLWPALWPALGVAGLFVAVAFSDLLPMLPGWLHVLVLAGFAAAFAAGLWHAARTFAWPDGLAARRRLEQASGLTHRPLTVLDDSLAAGADNPESRALWAHHRRRMAATIAQLRVGTPAPGLPRRDPRGLRAAVVLLLVVGAAMAWKDPVDRLQRAVTPQIALLAPAAPPALEIWITPPAYTGAAPIFPKTAAAGAPLVVPTGSTVTAQVGNARSAATLSIGRTRTAFEQIDPANSRIETKIEAGDRLAVEHGGKPLGDWAMTVVPDNPPTIAFAEKPAATPQAALVIQYTAGDDYGIAQAKAEIRRSYEGGKVVGQEVLELPLPLPGAGARKAKETTFQDLAPHPWAGLAVLMRLTAVDAIGQAGHSEEIALTLPEREFKHPVARAIIEQRRRLTTEPERRMSIADAIEDIARRPGAFDHDTVVFLSLASARSRLFHEKEESAIAPVRDLLWDTALRVEDGKLSLVERDLRRAEEALMRALAENASDEELERLMRELQQAMNRFLEALAEQMQQNPQAFQQMPMDPNAQVLDSADLQRMMDQIREMMRSGARDAARQMLSQLRNMLEMMRNAQMMQPGQQQGNQAMRQLQDLIQRQQQLMDQTFQQSRQRGQQPGQGQDGAGQQRALQQMLQQLRDMMGQMQGQMGQQMEGADRSMGEALRALEGGQPGNAVGPQGQAIEQLRQLGQGMMQQMMEQMGNQQGFGFQGQFNPLQGKRDPLGRYLPNEGEMDTNDVKIPDEGDIQRAQRILEELRRRAGQQFRPLIERDYIDRLLRQF